MGLTMGLTMGLVGLTMGLMGLTMGLMGLTTLSHNYCCRTVVVTPSLY